MAGVVHRQRLARLAAAVAADIAIAVARVIVVPVQHFVVEFGVQFRQWTEQQAGVQGAGGQFAPQVSARQGFIHPQGVIHRVGQVVLVLLGDAVAAVKLKPGRRREYVQASEPAPHHSASATPPIPSG